MKVLLPVLALLQLLFGVRVAQCQNNCTQFNSGFRVVHCPEGWVRYKFEKCFKAFVNIKTQPESQKSCLQMNANLASIHSDDEFEFMKSYILREVPLTQLGDFWIGAMKRVTTWTWADLTRFDYTIWSPGHPTGFDCVILATYSAHLPIVPETYGRMYTMNCSEERHFVCQTFQADARAVTYLH